MVFGLLPLLLCAQPTTVEIPASVRSATQTNTTVELIVMVRGDASAVARELGLAPYRSFTRLQAFAAKVSPAQLEKLAADPRVAGLQLDDRGRPLTDESSVAIHSLEVRESLGLSGRGVNVAVLDTGIDANHPDLKTSLVHQKCFVLAGCPPQNSDTGDLASEGDGHGTHVSGTITSNGEKAPVGVAPAAGIVAVRVFDDAEVGRVSDWAAAMDWVLANNAELKVRAVNLSLGTGMAYTGACDQQQPLLTAAINSLRDGGVLVFAAAGNEGLTDSMTAPACVSSAVAVGATYDSDLGVQPASGHYSCGCSDDQTSDKTVACFSNSSDGLDLLAPGSQITSTAMGGGKTTKVGTSMAVPHASAVAALLWELDPSLTADDVEKALTTTGPSVVDPKSMRSTHLLDAKAAAERVRTTFCERSPMGAACTQLSCTTEPCAGVCAAQGCVPGPKMDPPPTTSPRACSQSPGALLPLLLLALWCAPRPVRQAQGRLRSG